MRRIINHFTDDDLYKFTMCCSVVENYPRAQVRYRFTDRNDMVYPQGFARQLRQQIDMLAQLVITDEEIEFMKRRCPYIPVWFYSYLKGFRYNPDCVTVSQDEAGHLSMEIEGYWSETILFEVKLLAIVSELYYILTGHDKYFDYGKYAVKSAEKAQRLLDAGCSFSDFGTRRRASFEAQATVVRTMARVSREGNHPGRFTGTSNVYLAMVNDITPIGTMAHEMVCAIAGMYGPQMANYLAMEMWRKTYRGALGTFLYDTYGWEIFSLNFSEDYANMFRGLRVDSGNNFEQLDLIIDKYHSLGIDPLTKQVIFSNALDVDRAIAIQQYAKSKCQPSFGIGTHFTNDFPEIKPLNIVIKLTDVKMTESWPRYFPTCKLSEDRGKYSGDPEVVKRFLSTLQFK